jgi:hypothetical protein
MLTFRAPQPSRLAMLSVVMDASIASSSSQRRPRAIAATNVARVSERIGRACCGNPSGRRISRRRVDEAFCHCGLPYFSLFQQKPRRGTMSGQSWLLRSKERTWTVVTRYRRVAPPVTDITKLSFQRFHQPPNGQGSRPHCALVSAHPRRRGDQITRRYPLALDCRGYWCGLRREGQRWADIFISAADA